MDTVNKNLKGENMIQIKNIVKTYLSGENEVRALKDVSINFRNSEFVSILGPSGCGKTTMLNIIGGLDKYTDGDIVINGVSTKEYKDKDWDAYRNHYIGFVFQFYNLVQNLTALENVELATQICKNALNPKKVVKENRQTYEHLVKLFKMAMERQLERRSITLEYQRQALSTCNPLEILARGYSVTTDESGVPLSSINSVQKGQQIITRLSEGEILSTVADVVSFRENEHEKSEKL